MAAPVVPPVPQPPGWSEQVLALPDPPPDADVASIPAVGILGILINADVAAQDLATQPNATFIGNALTAGMGIEKFADAVARVVGFQPIRQKAPRSTPDGQIETGNESYIGQFLAWGNANREAFKRVLYTVFNNYAAPMQTNVTNAVAGNVTINVDMAVRAKHFVHTHPAQQVFEKYLTPIPIPTPQSDTPFMMTIPSYDVRQIADVREAGAGISDYRKRAMQRGFLRMERLHSVMVCMNHIGDEMKAAKEAVAALNLPVGTVDAIRGAGGNGGGGPAAVPNPILTYLFDQPPAAAGAMDSD